MSKAAGTESRRLFIYNGGFLTQPRIKRILQLAGWNPVLGLPRPGDLVGIWGNSPTAWRGKIVAAKRDCGLISVEDAFLRSILPGRAKGKVARRGPIGLLIDPIGVHFDPSRPSLIENLVASGQAAVRDAQAAEGIARLRRLDLSKYNAHDPQLAPPEPGYVLVIDQTRGDASLMGAGRNQFLAMLAAARAEHPGRTIVIRTHPETASGLRPGHYLPDDLRAGEILHDLPVSPWKLLDSAAAVYAISSQLGYEAVLAGHRPRLFGAPFYAGWDLSDDEISSPRRGRATKETLFAASHLLAPVWYDPCRDVLTDFDGAVNQIEAEAKIWRQDRNGHLAYGMRLWKRRFIANAFGDVKPVRFTSTLSSGVTLAWGAHAATPPQALRVEDGFLRSRGLGAALVPPLSLVADGQGIYYDPSYSSDLENLIATPITEAEAMRAERLIALITASGLSKYNLTAELEAFFTAPNCHVILVPGQVEDDASIRLGASNVRTNRDLLARVRQDNPGAFLIYKPHPDVESGLRPGLIPPEQLLALADHVAQNADPIALLSRVDAVWTMTSTMGFEALLRGVPVTTFGAPFYAGWGLTRDLGQVPPRRQARPSLLALAHACLISYPRYRDPKTGLPCPPEIAVDRLITGFNRQNPHLRMLAKLQGALAGHSWIWRR